ncbi:phage major tail tube protein [Viridibacillus arvi]|uniref:phage major tail tube protein n=1 Tax=Viridibacillus arvi TaxID=263475 RepID=UPI0034CF74D0
MGSLIPEKINDYRIFPSGKPDLLGTADVQLPKLESMTESMSGAGIAGEYEASTLGHFQSMQLTINWRMLTGELATFLKPDALDLDCRVANQEYDKLAGSYKFVPNRIVVKGHAKGNDLGKVSKGGTYEASTEIEVTYLKLIRDGKTLIEIDKLNYKYVVDGVDVMKPIRKALGME